ncbi:hypothetical protein GN244_ATG02031 [Phytophthora infestans]|uniref:Uncharacterized protein n=1 Tax=Phytophthora infestans TaxID=4787 RepID=A0A833SCB6_PHYIN|nr:hypothetical protein GN244_ATG02031 [Phytophthora infestans]
MEITAWALTIHADVAKQERSCTLTSVAENGPQASVEDYVRKQTTLLERQTSLISELTTQVNLLADRMRQLENGSSYVPEHSKIAEAAEAAAAPFSQMKSQGKTQSRANSPSSVWYEWFCDLSPFTHTNKRRHHECKVTVAFMWLFLPYGYNVISDDGQLKARILQSGLEAEAGIQALLAEENITAKSYGTIVKVLKRLHTDGKLNNHITRFQTLQQQGLVLDPTPPKSQHVLQLCYPTQPSQP